MRWYSSHGAPATPWRGLSLCWSIAPVCLWFLEGSASPDGSNWHSRIRIPCDRALKRELRREPGDAQPNKLIRRHRGIDLHRQKVLGERRRSAALPQRLGSVEGDGLDFPPKEPPSVGFSLFRGQRPQKRHTLLDHP